MEITYGGGNEFLVSGSASVTLNPVGPAPAGSIVLHTDRKRALRTIVSGPGEYELRGVLITTIRAGMGLAHAIDLDGVTVLVLAGSWQPTLPAEVAALGRVDLLLIETSNVEEARTLTAMVAPRTALPFGGSAAEFCTALGSNEAQPTGRFNWNGVSTPPKIVLLKAPKRARRVA